MVKYPSIEAFKSVYKQVVKQANYHGVELPTIFFYGTVKLHGTNAGVRFEKNGTLSAQSRERPLTLQSDNYGFAMFVELHKEKFFDLFPTLIGSGRTLYGEWCGPGIQKNVAISMIPKKIFVVFGMSLTDAEDSPIIIPAYFKTTNDDLIRHITESGSAAVSVDFKNPQSAIEALELLTLNYEKECPFGKLYGISGIGEGLVWQASEFDPIGIPGIKTSDLQFKTKGEKHGNKATDNKVKVRISEENLNGVTELISLVLPDWRLEQGLEQVGAAIPQNTGNFIKWVVSDVFKEESDQVVKTAADLGIDSKLISSEIANAARRWFMKKSQEVV